MMAYTVELMSVERVMSCISRYTSAEPSRSEDHFQELPYDTEDAIVTWINKVRTGGLLCTCMGDTLGPLPENTRSFVFIWRGDGDSLFRKQAGQMVIRLSVCLSVSR